MVHFISSLKGAIKQDRKHLGKNSIFSNTKNMRTNGGVVHFRDSRIELKLKMALNSILQNLKIPNYVFLWPCHSYNSFKDGDMV